MLRLMLDAHPALAIPPESHFIPHLFRVRRRYQSGDGFDADRLASDIMAQPRVAEWRLDETRVRERVAALEQASFAGVVEAAFMTYADAHGKSRWGDKCPPYVGEIPLLARVFPAARFVHLIRDGRDVAASVVQSHLRTRNLAQAAAMWAERVRAGRRGGSALGPARYLEARYEDLVADPERELKAICAFAALDFTPELLTYYERADEVLTDLEKGRHPKVKEAPAVVRDWRRDMPRKAVAMVEAVAGDALEEFGYLRATPTAPAGVRMRAKASLGVRRFRRRLKRRGRAAKARLSGAD